MIHALIHLNGFVQYISFIVWTQYLCVIFTNLCIFMQFIPLVSFFLEALTPSTYLVSLLLLGNLLVIPFVIRGEFSFAITGVQLQLFFYWRQERGPPRRSPGPSTAYQKPSLAAEAIWVSSLAWYGDV